MFYDCTDSPGARSSNVRVVNTSALLSSVGEIKRSVSPDKQKTTAVLHRMNSKNKSHQNTKS